MADRKLGLKALLMGRVATRTIGSSTLRGTVSSGGVECATFAIGLSMLTKELAF
jgi:hypothetical protein